MPVPAMRFLAPVMLAVLAAGCGKLADNLPPEGAVRSLHAVPDLDNAIFFVENRTTSGTASEYLGDTPLFRVGTDTYHFRFEVQLPGETSREVAQEFDQEIVAGEEYTFVLSGTAASPTVLTWQRSDRDFAGADVVAAGFGHAAEGTVALDFYLEAPGFDPLAATPRASLAYGELGPDVDLAPGDYQLVITAAGNAADVRFVSDSFTLAAADQVLFAVLDGAGIGTAPLTVRVMGSSTVLLLRDTSAPTRLRAAHAALDTGAVDVVIDGNFGTPLVAGLAFAELSTYRDLDYGERALTVTPAGDSGVLLVEDTLSLAAGSLNSLFFTGPPETLTAVAYPDDGRRLARYARLRAINADAAYNFIDVYVVPSGEDFTQYAALLQDLQYKAATTYRLVPPDSYDLYITPANSATVLAGPVPLDAAAGGIYGLFVTDATDPDTAQLVPMDDLAP